MYLISDLSTELNTTLNITGPSNTRIVEYRIISATVGCRVWDDLIQQWDKSHCEVIRVLFPNQIFIVLKIKVIFSQKLKNFFAG